MSSEMSSRASEGGVAISDGYICNNVIVCSYAFEIATSLRSSQ
jgi:hypothetical protein